MNNILYDYEPTFISYRNSYPLYLDDKVNINNKTIKILDVYKSISNNIIETAKLQGINLDVNMILNTTTERYFKNFVRPISFTFYVNLENQDDINSTIQSLISQGLNQILDEYKRIKNIEDFSEQKTKKALTTRDVTANTKSTIQENNTVTGYSTSDESQNIDRTESNNDSSSVYGFNSITPVPTDEGVSTRSIKADANKNKVTSSLDNNQTSNKDNTKDENTKTNDIYDSSIKSTISTGAPKYLDLLFDYYGKNNFYQRIFNIVDDVLFSKIYIGG